MPCWCYCDDDEGYGFGAVNAASWFSLPPGPFWKSGVDFWVAALVLLLTSMVATREVGPLLSQPLAYMQQASVPGLLLPPVVRSTIVRSLVFVFLEHTRAPEALFLLLTFQFFVPAALEHRGTCW